MKFKKLIWKVSFVLAFLFFAAGLVFWTYFTKSQYDKVLTEVRLLVAQHIQKQERIEILSAEFDALKTENAALEQKNSIALEEIRGAERHLSEKESELRSLQQRIVDLETVITDLERK